jgi:hypothetical protein
MNTTLEYITQDEHTAKMLQSLCFRGSDVVVGTIEMNIRSMNCADATTPLLHSHLQWFVPCPTPVPKVERVLGIFTLTVWFTFILVLFLTAVTVWCAASSHFTLPEYESPMYRTLSSSLYNLWAVVLCVSVAQQPRTSRLRVLFLLFVCYNFGFNVVFQAFFMTFLVEPGFRKPIATFDELVHSGILYGYNDGFEILLNRTDYYEHVELKSPRVDCIDSYKCLERLITAQDITMVSSEFYAHYTSLKFLPNYGKRKYLCSLNQDI